MAYYKYWESGRLWQERSIVHQPIYICIHFNYLQINLELHYYYKPSFYFESIFELFNEPTVLVPSGSFHYHPYH